MQTSFIPKKPIVESRSEGAGISLFLLLAIIIFIVSVALAAFVWIYKDGLNNKIEEDKKALESAKSSYEEGTIAVLIRLDNRITESEKLLKEHLAISPVFELLEKNVVRDVRLKTFKFNYATAEKIKIDLTGVAKNYEALSKQSDAFGLEADISQPVVSDFSPNPDGSVSFSFSALVKASRVTYSKNINSTSP